MDPLSQVNVDTFKILVWIAAAVFGGLFVIGRPVASRLIIASRAVSAILAATVAFIAVNLAVVFYILAHLTDSRWSVGKDPKIESPKLSAGPFFEPITNTLNDALNNVTGSLNNVITIKNAFLTMPDFIGSAGWALHLLLPLVITLHFIGRAIKNRQAQQVARNTQDLADIRSQLGLSPLLRQKSAPLK